MNAGVGSKPARCRRTAALLMPPPLGEVPRRGGEGQPSQSRLAVTALPKGEPAGAAEEQQQPTMIEFYEVF